MRSRQELDTLSMQASEQTCAVRVLTNHAIWRMPNACQLSACNADHFGHASGQIGKSRNSNKHARGVQESSYLLNARGMSKN